MTLAEAIDATRAAGIEILYSTDLVKEWMQVRENPHDDDPVMALRSALQQYSLDLEAGGAGRWLIVQVERDGPAPSQAFAEATPAPEKRVALKPLDEITIVGSRHTLFDDTGATNQFLTGEQIRSMPHMADDTFRALHWLPGIASNDFQAPFNLRGGATDEVRIQLDGLELIEPFHMQTLYSPLSIVDPGIIGGAELLSGGFAAEHGNFMSGVVDISSERAAGEPAHEVGVSFVSAFARSKGVFGDQDRGSYLVSARRGYLDLIAETLVDDGEELSPRYGDFYSRVSYIANDWAELAVQALLADDRVSFVDPGDGEDFGENTTIQYLWVSADVEPWPGVTGSNVLFAGRVEGVEAGTQDNPPGAVVSRTLDRDTNAFGFQSDWVFRSGDRHMTKAGVRYRDVETELDYRLNSVRRSEFVNNGAPYVLIRDIQFANDGSELAAYAAYRSRIGDNAAIELGARWDRQDFGPAFNESQLTPRVNLVWGLSKRTSLRLAWGEFSQAQSVDDIAIADGDTRYYDPQLAEHIVAGLDHTFASGLQLQTDIYSKDYSDLRPRYENLLDVYEFAPESNFDRVVVIPESGRAYGAELTLRDAASGGLDWWVSYAWSKAEDKIDADWEPRTWDQRHALTANIEWRSDKWTFSAVGRYHSGWPRTPLNVNLVFDGAGNVVGIEADLSARNSTEFDDYSRLDIRASRRVELERGSFEYYFELFNVFDTGNQCCTSSHTLTLGQGASVAPEFDEFLPRFPSFGFIWRFGPGAE